MEKVLNIPTGRKCQLDRAGIGELIGSASSAATVGKLLSTTASSKRSALTTGSAWSAIWHMSVPMVLNMMVLSLANFTEGWIAGRLGPDALSALGLCSQIWFFDMLLTLALSAGTISVLSRNYGAGDKRSTIESARQALLLSVVFGGAISIISLVVSRPLLSLFCSSAAVREIGWNYLKFTGMAAMPYTVLWISNSVFRAKGDARTPMMTQLAVCACTIILDFVFCLQPFRLGLSGIGLSWLFSSLLGITINIFAIKHCDLAQCLDWIELKKLRISFYWLGQFLSVGLPASMQDISIVSSSFGLFYILGHCLDPVTSQAAWAAGWRLEETVTLMPMYGLNIAAASIIGQNVGAQNFKRAKSSGWQIAAIAGAINIVIAILLFSFASQIASILTEDRVLTASTVAYVKTICWTEPFFAFWLVLSGCLQGAGYTRVPMVVTVVCFNGFRLVLAWYLSQVLSMGASGVWLSMAASTTFAGLWMIWVWSSDRWQSQ